MNFEDEEYVRLYCKDTVTTNKIGWEGRLVLWEIMRKVDCAGVLDLEEGDDEVEAVASLIKVPEEIVRVGLAALASRGVTHHHGASLVVTKFVEAQNAKRSDRLRAQEYRDRKKIEALEAARLAAEIGGEMPPASRPVTGRHDSSLPAPPLPALPHSHTHTSELLAPTPEHEKLGAELDLDTVHEFARFKAQAKGKGRKMADEGACFELWLRDEAKKPRSGPRASPRGVLPAQTEDDLRRARNLALENAEAGRYGPKARELAKTLRGVELTALADRLAKAPPPPMRLAADG